MTANHKDLIEKLLAARRVSVPIAAVNTFDQPALTAAVRDALQRGPKGKEIPVLEWDFVRGIHGINEAGAAAVAELGDGIMQQTQRDPIAALSHALRIPEDAILFFANSQRWVDHGGVSQGLINLRDPFKASGRMIILVGIGINLPAEISSDVVQWTEPLPDDERLTAIITEQVEGAAGQFEKTPGPELIKRAATALRGTSAFGAEQLSAMSLRKKGDGIDIETLHTQARALIEQTPGLTFERGRETFEDIGGLDFAKEWGRRIFRGPCAPAVIVRVEEIEKAMAGAKGDLSGTSGDALQVLLTEMEDSGWDGMLAYGPPGCSKSLFGKSLANSHGAKAVVFDINSCKGSLVGQSLHPNEEVYICGAGGQNTRRMTIKEAHELYTPGADWFTWTVNRHGGAVIRRVTAVIKHSRNKRFVRVTTRSGRTVVVTEDHSLFKLRRAPMPAAIGALQGGEEAKRIGSIIGSYSREDALESVATSDVQIGDRIAIVHHLPCGQNHDKYVCTERLIIPISEDVMQLAGLWVGDGSLNNKYIRISSTTDEPEVGQFLEAISSSGVTVDLKKEYHRKVWSRSKPFKSNDKGRDYTLNDLALAAALRVMDFTGKSRTKRVPGWLYGAKRTAVAAFLRGYFSADGGISDHSIEASTVSERLARDVVLLLGRVGVFARLRVRRRPKDTPIYRITISKRLEQQKFADEVGFIQAAKNDALSDLLKRSPVKKYKAGRHLNGVLWDEVTAIEILGDDQPSDCYDLSIDGLERFVSGGVIVHNSERQIRQAMQVIRTIGGDRVFFIASCNGLETLTAALQRRFKSGVWFFDVPDDTERQRIWDIQRARFKIPAADPTPDEADLTGADIRNICEQSYKLACQLVDARRYVVPLKTQSPADIKAAREMATGRFTDASRGGVYERNKQAQAAPARRKVNVA